MTKVLEHLAIAIIGMIVLALLLLAAASAHAQFRKLESFSYGSDGCGKQLSNLMDFRDPNGTKSFQMLYVAPGGGKLPPSYPFWLRGISIDLNQAEPGSAVMVGHGGSTDLYSDPMTSMGPGTHTVMFPPDTAVIVGAGDYFDVHSSDCTGWVYITFYWSAYTTGIMP